MRVGAPKFPGIKRLTPAEQARLKTFRSSFASADGSCIGCGGELALRLVSSALNWEAANVRWRDQEGRVRGGGAGGGLPGIMLTEHTGCEQVCKTTNDTSAWMRTFWEDGPRSMLHATFSDGTPLLTGLHYAYQARIKNGTLDQPFFFWSFAGDGATTIGAGPIMNFLQQGWGLLIIYDNRGYMNTGAQVSSTTWPFENRATTPVGVDIPGNQFFPVDWMRIAAALNVPFAATASPAFPMDLMEKVRYAINVPGPTIIWVDSPCPKEQGFGPELTKDMSRLAVDSGLFPIVRYQDGEWAVDILRSQQRTGKPTSLEAYFGGQVKSRHLASPAFDEQLRLLSKEVERRYAWYLRQAGYEPVPAGQRKNGQPTVRLGEGVEAPSLYLPPGVEEPIRSLDQF
ncbi:hypothetical protein A3J44_01075 [candidate division WOR-1 bacterium RIFCSPHIGHO2_02_FULL_45_12]|nr:MAG: hypothetical protein A3J44_01075 [candidate division WOR-1 bacterium RIFCSPHIGHO2_02_FULL_45_12]